MGFGKDYFPGAPQPSPNRTWLGFFRPTPVAEEEAGKIARERFVQSLSSARLLIADRALTDKANRSGALYAKLPARSLNHHRPCELFERLSIAWLNYSRYDIQTWTSENELRRSEEKNEQINCKHHDQFADSWQYTDAVFSFIFIWFLYRISVLWIQRYDRWRHCSKDKYCK